MSTDVESTRDKRGASRHGLVSALTFLAAALIIFAPVPLCPWAALAHIPCPGCGLTRATLLFVQGRFAESFRMHPLAIVMTPTVIVTLVRDLYGYAHRGRWGEGQSGGRAMTWFAGVLVVAMLGVWLARFAGFLGGPVPVN